MSRPRPALIPLALAAACYLLTLLQRPGDVVADTKLDLYVDPRGFLGEVASAWTEQVQLGHVFGGQYGGYLFPMAPWFAAGDVLGLPVWLVHRLWLGTLLALAAWGAVRLMDALLERPRGAPHVAAALIFVLNPYVTVYANRTSISLLAYAALPWLLLAVHRGLREPKAWRWPALFALVLTCTGGGVNLAVTGWVLVGPLLFIVYERTLGGVGPKAIWPFLLRLAPIALLANVWWLAPAFVHLRYGLDFLPFTEQPGTIWQTTSITESLRLMGFWTSYIGGGFGGELRPFSSHAPALLFHPAVLVASLLIPALTLGGFAWTRRWRYGPWFLILALTGLAIMVTGFPEGTPLRKAFTFTYNHAEPLRFLRTTYKAGPLLALALAGLGGALAGVAWDRSRGGGARAALAAGTLAICAVAAWPLTTGRAPERQLVFDVPQYWYDTADAVDAMPAGRRAMVLPGRLFGYYDWGGTIDPILPSLAKRPVAERMIVPFADLRSVDLQFTTDALVSQERALPGQVSPLLRLMGVGSVVSTADDDRKRSGAIGPVEAEDVLARQEGLGAPRPLGPVERERAAAGRVAADRELPRVGVRDVASPGAMVSVLPRGRETVVDGSAEGIAQLAAFGGLDPAATPLAYAADLTAEQIRAAAAAGGEVVITDSNRRQAFVASRMRANRGPVLPPSQSLSEDGAMLDPFDLGPDAQTVSRLRSAGPTRVAELFAPSSPQTAQVPEHRPAAALDGDPRTMWLADRALAEDRHWMEVRFARPVDVGTIEVLPYGDERGRPRVLDVAGRRVSVGRGWTRVAVNRKGLRALRITIADATEPVGGTGGAGGIAELRIPGIQVRETLRPPVLAERALRGRPVDGSLTYLFSRVTTDAPGRTGGAVGLPQTHLLRDRTDPEPQLDRTFTPPVARRWTVDAWVRPRDTPGPALDRLAGTTGTVEADGPREGGLARHRASRAFDGDPRTAWIAPWVDPDGGDRGAPSATMELRLERTATVRRLRLVPAAGVRRPTRVLVAAAPGTEAVEAAVAPDGTVALPRAVRGQRLSLRVLAARFASGASGVERRRRAVGIAEVEGVPGARVRDAAPTAALRGDCGSAGVGFAGGEGEVALRPVGTVAQLEAGDALRAVQCGAPVALDATEQRLRPADGASFTLDHVRLRSTASGAPTATTGVREAAGRVVGFGDEGNGSRTGVRVQVDAPGWLVLGESISAGWKATCDGKALGAPVPMQGFANAWKVEPGCTDVDFTWAPNATLGPAYGISLLTCLALLALLALTARQPVLADGPRTPFPDADPPRPWRWRRALVAGAAAALAIGFVFALRAGVVAFPVVVLVLRFAVPARTLALAGGALLTVLVPVLYLVDPVRNAGGYNSNLAVDRIAAHWVGVAAILLVVAALARTLAAARPDRAARAVPD